MSPCQTGLMASWDLMVMQSFSWCQCWRRLYSTLYALQSISRWAQQRILVCNSTKRWEPDDGSHQEMPGCRDRTLKLSWTRTGTCLWLVSQRIGSLGLRARKDWGCRRSSETESCQPGWWRQWENTTSRYREKEDRQTDVFEDPCKGKRGWKLSRKEGKTKPRKLSHTEPDKEMSGSKFVRNTERWAREMRIRTGQTSRLCTEQVGKLEQDRLESGEKGTLLPWGMSRGWSQSCWGWGDRSNAPAFCALHCNIKDRVNSEWTASLFSDN